MVKHVCPHCGTSMDPITTPLESSWGGEIHHICFNDECCYFVKSWEILCQQGVDDTGYRCRIDPRGDRGPMPVWSKDALRNLIVCDMAEPKPKLTSDFFDRTDMAREDETPDQEFYLSRGPEDVLDSLALSTVKDLYMGLVPKGGRVLDLMAGSDSHVHPDIEPAEIVGLGLDPKELGANGVLTESVVVDLNTDPVLPFEDDRFDAVICSLSIQYLTKPIEIFSEAARVLKPRKRLIVAFSNRMLPQKAVALWKGTHEGDRPGLVKRYFQHSGFAVEAEFTSTGKPRPKDDKYYSLGIPSDPIYAVWGKPIE
ncbi:MAG: methyltransferase domain-containing protein [Pseudomonadota bacterium]